MRARRATLALAGLLLVAVVPAVWAYEQEVGYLPGERFLRFEAYQRPVPAAADVLVWLLEALGSSPGVLLVTLVGGALVWRAYGARTAALVPAAVLAGLLARAFKALLGPTPLQEEVMQYAPRIEAALPSGHTAYATATFGLFAVLAAARKRWWLSAACAALVPAIAVARVVSGAHLPSDVVAGCALGAGWLLLLLAVAPPLDHSSRVRRAA